MTFGLGISSVSGVAQLGLTLAGGWWIFLIFVVVFFFAVVFGYYTVKGSGISLTPYRRADGPPESPPEIAHDLLTQDVRNWQRGTEGHRGRHRPPAIQTPVDPVIADALGRWRRGSVPAARLEPPVRPDDHVRGPAGATTVAIYLDVASEPCRSAFALLTRLASERPLQIVVRHLPLADVHALALPAAEALEAAGAQGMFFDLLDRLVSAPMSSEEGLLTVAGSCVADPERLREEVRGERYRDTIAQQIDQAAASGAHDIPALYIDAEHYGGDIKTDPLTRALVAKGASSPGG